VVARTFEVGTRGRWSAPGARIEYAASAFRTTNHDDILFISSGMVANTGYFKNVGLTRRQGVEVSAHGHHRLGGSGHGARLDWSAQYTFLDATFQSPYASPSANHPAAVNGQVAVAAGAHLPSLPAHVGKASVIFTAPFGLSVGLMVIANGSQYYRGDEANLLSPLPGYVIVNLTAAYQLGPHVAARARVNNLFDSNYSTFGVLGDAAGVLGPAYPDPRFRGPGAPIGGWVGLDLAL
jgi:iron complex outermembrane receptor protein